MDTFDWQRMLFGDLSWVFVLEIIVRSVIMYVYTFGMVRLMGKRTTQQLSSFEFIIVIALGSAVGDPMFYVVEGKPHTLIVDGRIDFKGMRHETLALEELFGQLRKSGVEQLGQVKYAYLEQSGAISLLLYRHEEAKPGLAIVPPWDIRRPESFSVPSAISEGGIYVCLRYRQRHSYNADDTLLLCPACANA